MEFDVYAVKCGIISVKFGTKAAVEFGINIAKMDVCEKKFYNFALEIGVIADNLELNVI